MGLLCGVRCAFHDDIIKWKHFPRFRPFVRRIHRTPVNSLHKSQWRRALMFSLICAWTDCWANNGDASDFRHYRAHYDVIVMSCFNPVTTSSCFKCNLFYNSVHFKCNVSVRNWFNISHILTTLWILMVWCFSFDIIVVIVIVIQ